jgi:hypothetical protein
MTTTAQPTQPIGGSALSNYFTLRSTVVGSLCGLLFSLGRKYFSGEPVMMPLLITLGFLLLSLNESFWRVLVKQKIVSETVLSSTGTPIPAGKPRVATTYTSCENLVGKAFAAATEQAGSRFIQKAVSDKDPHFNLIFPELLHHIPELTVDQFGNYLVQAMLEHCQPKQQSAIIQRLCSNIFKFSCSGYGVRCIQMMIDVAKHDESHTQSICHSLRGNICTLTRDLYGNHVVQRCLKVFPREETEFISQEIKSDLVGACSHPYGCCVMQLVLERSNIDELKTFVSKLQKDTVRLAQCPYGNYVVQLLVGLKDPETTSCMIAGMKGHIGDLSAHKFSSNVVEKCLQVGDREARSTLIKELITSAKFERLLQDPFGNYVVQKAMSVAQGELLTEVMDAIRPFVDSLRAAPYGRRIYNKFYKHERIMATSVASREASTEMADL